MPVLSPPLVQLDFFARGWQRAGPLPLHTVPQNFIVTTIEFDGLLWAPCLFASVTKYV